MPQVDLTVSVIASCPEDSLCTSIIAAGPDPGSTNFFAFCLPPWWQVGNLIKGRVRVQEDSHNYEVPVLRAKVVLATTHEPPIISSQSINK